MKNLRGKHTKGDPEYGIPGKCIPNPSSHTLTLTSITPKKTLQPRRGNPTTKQKRWRRQQRLTVTTAMFNDDGDNVYNAAIPNDGDNAYNSYHHRLKPRTSTLLSAPLLF